MQTRTRGACSSGTLARAPGAGEAWPAPKQWTRPIRAVCRGVAIVVFTLSAGVLQTALLRAPGRGKVWLALLYWGGVARLLGLRVQVIGQTASQAGRPVVFASNHSSWLDILALGSTLDACFVAKAEVGRWPGVGAIARLGRTAFVTRRARDTGRERDAMRARLAAGDNLLLFPEGTSDDGSRVLPFRTALFSVCDAADGEVTPWVQPVSVVYDRLDGFPVGRAGRAILAWYGDMELGQHFWQLMRFRTFRATVLLHEPIDPADFPSRKALSAAAWRTVSEGADALRQGRLSVRK